MQKELLAYAYCKDCGYETGRIFYSDLILQLSNEGEYIVSDKAGDITANVPGVKAITYV